MDKLRAIARLATDTNQIPDYLKPVIEERVAAVLLAYQWAIAQELQGHLEAERLEVDRWVDGGVVDRAIARQIQRIREGV